VGIGADGRLFFTATYNDQQALFVWEDGTISRIADLDPEATVDHGDPVLLTDADTGVSVIGPTPSGVCPLPPTVVVPTPTATATDVASPTPTIAVAAESPTVTTGSPSCGPGVVCVQVGTATGAPGSTVTVEVRMAGGNSNVAGLQNDDDFPAGIQVTACSVDPAIHKPATSFAMMGNTVRAIVLSLAGLAPIPDGATLYACDVTIEPSLPPGHYTIGCRNAGASDAQGHALVSACADGALDVIASDASNAAPTALAASSPTITSNAAPTAPSGAANADQSAENGTGGCAITPPDSGGAVALLFVAAALAGVRRRRCAARGCRLNEPSQQRS
jgi:MYXO-CTERM domain-containing protein